MYVCAVFEYSTVYNFHDFYTHKKLHTKICIVSVQATVKFFMHEVTGSPTGMICLCSKNKDRCSHNTCYIHAYGEDNIVSRRYMHLCSVCSLLNIACYIHIGISLCQVHSIADISCHRHIHISWDQVWSRGGMTWHRHRHIS